MNEVVIPKYIMHEWMREVADDMLPVDGWVTAKELSDNDEHLHAVTELLDILVESGFAMAALTEVGDQKEWIYGRLNARQIN